MLTEEAPPPPLDPQQPVLYIECCQSRADYRQRAMELHLGLAEALHAMNPEVQLQLRLNEHNAAREGAFEVAIAATPTADADARHVLWSGLGRVPQSAKVPNVDDLIAPACLALRLRHSQAGSSSINLVRTSDGEISKILQRHGRRSL